MRRTLMVTLIAMFAIFPTAASQQFATLTYYDGLSQTVIFAPTGETVTIDAPVLGLVSPGPYPYEFDLTEPLHVYLQIRHFLYTTIDVQNNLTINLDNVPILEATVPSPPPVWYPGGDGIDLIDLGTVSAGTHNITMSATLPDMYGMDWFKVFELVEIHDVAVINITATSFLVDIGEPVNITVDIANEGGFPETVDVMVSYDSEVIDTKTVTLALGESKTEQFTWHTTGVPLGRYTITAEASVAVDDDPTDNTITTEWRIDIVPEFPTLIPLLLTLAILAASTIILRKKLR